MASVRGRNRHHWHRWRRHLAVLVGGIAGTGLRLAVGAIDGAATGWPWGTFVANLTGALALGYLLTRFLASASRTSLTIPLICQGVIGSYTTFSAFSIEVWRLMGDERAAMALTYAAASVTLGIVLARAGVEAAGRRA